MEEPPKILTAALIHLIPLKNRGLSDRREEESHMLTTWEVWSSSLCPRQSTLHCLLEVLPSSLLLGVHAVNGTCSHSLRLSKWWQWRLFGWLRSKRSHSCCWGTLLFGGRKNLILARGRTCRRYWNSLLYLLRRMSRLLWHWFLLVPHGCNSQRQLLQVSIQLCISRLQVTGLTKVRQVYLFWFSGNRWWHLGYSFTGCLKDKKKNH